MTREQVVAELSLTTHLSAALVIRALQIVDLIGWTLNTSYTHDDSRRLIIDMCRAYGAYTIGVLEDAEAEALREYHEAFVV